MSKIKVNEIEKASGSGITVPTGSTFTITDGLAVSSLPTVTVAKGGTNLTSFTAGDLLYATGSTTLAKLPKGTANQELRINSGATAPEWFTPAGSDFTPNFFVYRDDTFSFASVTETTVSFNLEKYESDNAFNTSTHKYTVPSGEGGKYFLYCMLRKNNFSGSRFFWQMKRDPAGGGSTQDLITAENTYSGDTYVGNFASTIRALTAGDDVWIKTYHNDSGSRELITDESCCYFGGYKLTD